MQKDDEVTAHRDKYAGSQAERSSRAAADAEANKVAKQLKCSKLSGNFGHFYSSLVLARIRKEKTTFAACLRTTEFMLLATMLVN